MHLKLLELLGLIITLAWNWLISLKMIPKLQIFKDVYLLVGKN